MRIGLLASVPFPPREGLGNYVSNLARGLRGHGHDVTVFTRGKTTRSADADGIAIEEVAAPPVYPFHVHWHGRAMRRALAQAGLDVIHAHSPLPPPPPPGPPTLLTFHTPILPHSRAMRAQDARTLLYKAQARVSASVERALIARADAVSAVSKSVANDLREYGVDPEEVVILPNAIDPERFPPGKAAREDFLLYTGHISVRKGVPDLIAAMEILAKRGARPRLILTGDGPERARLERRARASGLDNVEFRGFVSREELVRLCQTAALFVFPTHYEGLPTSLLEAMATGAPVLSTRAPGVVDLVEDGRTGRLCEPGAPAQLADAVEEMLSDPARRERLAAEARRLVTERHTWPAVTKQTLRVYEQLVGRGG